MECDMVRARSKLLWFATSLVVLGPGPGFSDDRPVVTISPDGVSPARLEVHVGEIVSWRSATGGRLRVELDAHPGAHEIIERRGEVRGVFRQVGQHWYAGSVIDNGARSFRGVVVVHRAATPVESPDTCAQESSQRICFDP
jgi:hypothetical protein